MKITNFINETLKVECDCSNVFYTSAFAKSAICEKCTRTEPVPLLIHNLSIQANPSHWR
jgi:hypothetical protein